MQRFSDLRPVNGAGRRERQQRADRAARAAERWEREHEQRKDRRKQRASNRARRLNAERRIQSSLPLELLASALAAGVGVRQAANDLGISPQRLNNALKEPPVQEGYQRCQEIQQDCRRRLRESAPAPATSRRQVLRSAGDTLATAFQCGVSQNEAAADLGIRQSTISRALQQGRAPNAPAYLVVISDGYAAGQERIGRYRAALRQWAR